MRDARIIERIGRATGIPDLVPALAERLPATDLQSLLLEVYRRRSRALTPALVLARYAADRFTRPSAADPVLLLEFDRLAFSLLPPGYEVVELSPVAPLGTTAAVSQLDQDLVLSTTRNSEVVADSTTVLALEAAARRHAAGAADRRERTVRLAASHRLLRAQPSPPPWRPHFRLLGLCTAGRDAGGWRFEAAALVEQLDFHLRLLTELPTLGLRILDLAVSLVELADGRRLDDLRERVEAPLRERFPAVEITAEATDDSSGGYYSGVRFRIGATADDGTVLQLVDGGLTSWTQRLLSDRKERVVTSGIGTELVCTRFLARAP